jgi:hypothetical protein
VSKDDYDKVVGETTKTINNMKIESELKVNLSGAKYPDLILGQIKRENINITENGIVGLKEEIERVKTAYPDMFEVKKVGETKGGGTTPAGATGEIDEAAASLARMRKAAGLPPK